MGPQAPQSRLKVIIDQGNNFRDNVIIFCNKVYYMAYYNQLHHSGDDLSILDKTKICAKPIGFSSIGQNFGKAQKRRSE